MFAYCGNNPVNYDDKSGTYENRSIRTTYVDRPGNDVWYRPVDNSPQSDFAKKMDKSIYEFTQNPEGFMMQYKWFVQGRGLLTINNAFYHIYKGLGLLLFPVPSLADELTGIWKIITGYKALLEGLEMFFAPWRYVK